jgi:hypothetical protein
LEFVVLTIALVSGLPAIMSMVQTLVRRYHRRRDDPLHSSG